MLHSFTRNPYIPDFYLLSIDTFDIFAAGCYYDTDRLNSDYGRAYKCFDDARMRGYIPAVTRLGIMYYEGKNYKAENSSSIPGKPKIGIPKEPERAFNLFLTAATLGDPTAMRYLAACYRDGHGTPPEEGLAEFWDEQSIYTPQLTWATSISPSLQGQNYCIDAEDLFAAGQFHRENNDNDRAGRCYWHAATRGHMGATNALGTFFAQALGGLKQDKSKAYHLIKLAAEGNYPNAMKNLSNCYRHGFGTDKNEALAQQWLDAYHVICPPITPALSSVSSSSTCNTEETSTAQTPSTSSGLGQPNCLFTPLINLPASSKPLSSQVNPVTQEGCHPF